MTDIMHIGVDQAAPGRDQSMITIRDGKNVVAILDERQYQLARRNYQRDAQPLFDQLMHLQALASVRITMRPDGTIENIETVLPPSAKACVKNLYELIDRIWLSSCKAERGSGDAHGTE